MLTVRGSQQRGYADHGWLKSHHSFSFANYYDSEHMGFGNLRVINEDRIAPGTGFGAHSHRDMEIISIVLEGELIHQDNLGHRAVIRPGEVQRMTAGSGVTHSEFNHSQQSGAHFFQIWILPDRKNLEPEYEQKAIPQDQLRGKLQLVAAPAGQTESGFELALRADARIYLGNFEANESASLNLQPGRLAYVHVIAGELTVNGKAVSAGDAVKLQDEASIQLEKGKQARVMVFDLAR